jgi:hypothetical protein
LPFLTTWLSPTFDFKVCKKANMIQTIFLAKMQYGYQKTQNIMLISNLLEKFQNHQAKKTVTEKVSEKWSF